MCIFRKNDWYPVWTEIGHWGITETYFDKTTSRKERCVFEILFSPSRDSYKLSISGETPKEHSAYKIAIAKLKEFMDSIPKPPKDRP